MVEVRNKKRQPIEGQEIIVSWSGGEESFFTGLKPEISDGYADFQMQAKYPVFDQACIRRRGCEWTISASL